MTTQPTTPPLPDPLKQDPLVDIAWSEARQHFDQEHADKPVETWQPAEIETYLNLRAAA